VLVAVGACNFIDRQILTILLQPIKRELGLSDTALGFLTGFGFAACFVIAGFPLARWADRGTRRSLIAVCVGLWSLMTMASGLVTSFGQLALARVGVAFGEAGSAPAIASLIADYYPSSRRARAMAIVFTGPAIGVFLGLMLGGWINQSFGWRSAFFAVGAPGLLLALIVHFVVAEPERGRVDARRDESVAHEPFRDVLRYFGALRTFRYLMLALACHSLTLFGWLAWAPTYLVRVHRLDTATVGLWMGLCGGVGIAVGNVIAGFVADRQARGDARWYLWVPALGSLIAMPSGVAFVLLGDPRAATLAVVPFFVMTSAWGAPTNALVQTLARPHMRGVAIAIMSVFVNILGLGLGPLLIGAMNDWLAPRFDLGAIRYSMLCAMLGLLLAAFCFLAAGRNVREDLERVRARLEPQRPRIQERVTRARERAGL